MRDALGSVGTLLVLGGGSDVGLAIARALVDSHTRTVVLAGRDPAALARPARVLRDAGAVTVDTVAFDADRSESHDALLGSIFDRHGDVDVALLAFGTLPDQQRAERETEVAVAAARTNFVGAVSVLTPLAARLRAQGHGTAIVLSSVAAERPRRSNYAYGAAKAGLDAFAQGLGDALAGSGARVMVVRPGFVRSKMTAGLPVAPLATTPDAVAAAVVAGLRRGAHTVWAPPTLRPVMAILRHLPRDLFRRLDL